MRPPPKSCYSPRVKRPFGDPERNRPDSGDRWEDDETTEVISLPPGWLDTHPPSRPDFDAAPREPRPVPTNRPALGLTAVRVINYLTGLIQGLLLVRVFFRAIGANPTAPAAQWVYTLSEPLIAPFAGLLPDPRAGEYVLELTTLFAVVVYTIAGFLLRRLMAFGAPARAVR